MTLGATRRMYHETIGDHVFREKDFVFENSSATRHSGMSENIMRRKFVTQLYPQSVLLPVLNEFVTWTLELMNFTIGKDFVESKDPLKIHDFEVSRKIKRLLLTSLSDIIFYFKDFAEHACRLVSRLILSDRERMDAVVSVFIERLQTIGNNNSSLKEQLYLLRSLTSFLKNLGHLSRELSSEMRKKVRVWLLNIGTNPERRALYHFVYNSSEKSYYIRFFKSAGGFIISEDRQLHQSRLSAADR